ncbi:serine/threonine protein kinase [Sulfitobacter sp. 1A15333]|uniref:serine/threonine protein kinase n=1 Tax=Sulfitobacter sp. 1A15333 TaxID=3368570 RepID=UPI0037477426
MAFEDWIDEHDCAMHGGQGVVTKVRNRIDGRFGALKVLHPDALIRKERRYRFQCEVAALRVLDGAGVPVVIEANESNWEKSDVPLYLVMEFIDGLTMEDLISRKPPTLDEALAATKVVIETLGHGHRLRVHHRDVKHNNIIMKHELWSAPVLVDLGMAWRGIDVDREFATPFGQELGNRFLRLPEYAPRGDHHDARSDLAMAAGLLFYMLSGKAPRQLIDHKGQLPHERNASSFPKVLTSDQRWSEVQRFFHVAFQHTPQLRFQSAEEMSAALSKIGETRRLAEEGFKDQLAKLHALKETQFHRERDAASSAMRESSLLLNERLRELLEGAGLTKAPVHPRFVDRGQCFQLIDRVALKDHEDPSVTFYHDVKFANGRLVASWRLDNSEPVQTYEGSAADEVGLREALLGSADSIAGEILGRLVKKLEPPVTLEGFFKQN